MRRFFAVSRIVRIFGSAAGRAGLLSVAAMLPGGVAAGQAYQQPTVVATGNWPRNFIAANLNGKPGFVYFSTQPSSFNGVAYTAQDSMFLEQSGGGSYASSAGTWGGIVSSVQAGAGNFLGHGFQDLVFAHTQPYSAGGDTPQSLHVDYEVANGDGTYGGVGEGADFTAQGSALPVVGAVAVADFNGDGLADLAVLDSANGYVYILLNNHGSPPGGSGGILTLTTTIALPNGGGSLLAGNLFGGKNTDMAVLGTSPHVVTLYRGNGDGTFTSGDTAALADGIFSMLSADLNGDGLPDLVAEGANGAVWVFVGGGTGFAAPVALTGAQDGVTGSGGHLVGIADLNGDGIADIVTSTPTGINVLLGQGSLTYKAGPSYNAGPGRSSYALADFNGDGHLDLAVDSPEGIAMLYGDGKGGFNTGVTFNTLQPAYDVAVGDFTGSGGNDAPVDAVVATGVPQVQVMKGDGNGNYVASSAASPAGAAETNAGRTVWSHVVAGEFAGDGSDDVVVALDGPISVDLGPCCTYPASDDGLSLMSNDGYGNLHAPQPIWPLANHPQYGEVVSANFFAANLPALLNFDLGSVVGYIGGSQNFAEQGPYYSFTSFADGNQHPYGQFTLGQFTQGRSAVPDMVQQFVNGSGANFLAVANNGGGGFTAEALTLEVPAGYVAPDLPTSTLPASGMYVSAMALDDLDNDGYGDLIVLYHNLAADPANPSASNANLLYIYWGNGVGTTGDTAFDPTPEIVTLSRNFYELAVANVAGDGPPYLVLSDGYVISVLEGNLSRSGFTSETHYLAGMGINGLAVLHVNSDGPPEILAANGGAVLSGGVANHGVLASNAEVNTGGLTVLGAPGTTTLPPSGTVTGTVTATPNPAPFGDGITFTATLTGSEQTDPTGMVNFYAGTLEIGTGSLTGGSGSYVYQYNPGVPPTLNAGTYTITAQYSGDSNYAATTLTGATPLVVTPVATTTTLVDVASPIFYGQIIADSGLEEVSPEPDGGTIDFLINGVVNCSLPYYPSGNEPTSCPPGTGAGFDAGTYMVQSVYSGDQNYVASSSGVITVVVQPDPTSASLTASTGTSSTVGQPVTFTATIADIYATARGTVDFFDGTTQIGTGTVNGAGQASFTTPALTLGTHSLSACLVASLDFLASSPCGTLSFTVNPVVPPPPPGPVTFTLAVNPSTISVGVGNSVAVQVVVTALNGFSQPVQLGCSGLPFETTCTFAQSLIPGGGGSTTLMVSPSAPHNCGANPPDFVAPNLRGGMAGLLLSVLAMLGLRRRRRLVKGLVLLVALGVLSAVSGCGTQCKDFGTDPINYTFTVTGTSTGSPVMNQTVTMKMDVHL